MPESDLLASITDWLEAERDRIATLASERQLPLAIEKEVPMGEASDEGSLLTYRVPTQVSSFSSRDIAFTLTWGADSGQGRVVAELIRDAFGHSCMIWGPQGNFPDDPVYWVEQNLLRLLRHGYLSQLRSLAVGDLALAAGLTRPLLEALESETAAYVLSIPVGGIRFDTDPMVIGDVLFRSMTPEELGQLNSDSFVEGDSTLAGIAPSSMRWMLEILVKWPKTQPYETHSEAARLLLALELLGFEIQGRGWIATRDKVFGQWARLEPYRLPEQGTTRDCSLSELEKAVNLAGLIPESVFREPQQRAEISLHRFMSAIAEQSPPDALIDYVIALEAALLGDNKELSFKLALFAAYYLGATEQRRSQVFETVKNAYAARSDVVHGRHPKYELQTLTQSTREVVAAILVKALEGEWPAPDYLTGLVLAGAQSLDGQG